MQKIYNSLAVAAIIAMITVPVMVMAETSNAGDDATQTDTMKARQLMRSGNHIENRGLGAKPDTRNNILESKLGRGNAMASSSERILKTMLLSVFKMRQQNISRELGLALRNLSNIRTRIQNRIDKATTAGRDMTTAKALLATADTKLAAAQNALNTLKNIAPSTTTATTTVDLGNPRQAASHAQSALKDARRSLVDVVIAIAHAMGLKMSNENSASRTLATSTATTTN